jgi:hypothetical protein
MMMSREQATEQTSSNNGAPAQVQLSKAVSVASYILKYLMRLLVSMV